MKTHRRSPKTAKLSLSNRMTFLKFGSASAKFRQLAQERDVFSRSVNSSSSHGLRERINGVFERKIDWTLLKKMGKEWIQNPMNMALFVWIMCVAISGAILFLVMTGMLDHALPKKSQRDVWFEVNNQILNALFTLMCLYQHPKRFYDLVLLCRWNPKDISRLRKIYCKNGTYKPHEWAHMMVVVALLHLNCFAQYALCGLNLGYRRSGRPAIGVAICISVAIAAPAAAGVYSILSPLGKDYESEIDEEEQVQITAGERPEKLRTGSLAKRYSFAIRDEQGFLETRPQWSGGILDFWDDISIAYLSLFCSFCVFGWNMERFGLGNMYVHILTFSPLLLGPFLDFQHGCY
ncbi:PLAC8 FAMILY PROTEIN-RELATED [Salix koriyanagi]|uniref:PLAC8 FAMILY PROTEIN-RELATED n=1 Tax=Salix koriyanagi TaxID=2511006 RepID=A0A9Q1AE69_9ROSI|nr:PLAC8 FAMILY PROTEIN-RELATED [Salix koriyanagi]KAJ6768211.1 PLAC8 FAMILY PROTEIN-RELATED [Salix koriyanagi]